LPVGFANTKTLQYVADKRMMKPVFHFLFEHPRLPIDQGFELNDHPQKGWLEFVRDFMADISLR